MSPAKIEKTFAKRKGTPVLKSANSSITAIDAHGTLPANKFQKIGDTDEVVRLSRTRWLVIKVSLSRPVLKGSWLADAQGFGEFLNAYLLVMDLQDFSYA